MKTCRTLLWLSAALTCRRISCHCSKHIAIRIKRQRLEWGQSVLEMFFVTPPCMLITRHYVKNVNFQSFCLAVWENVCTTELHRCRRSDLRCDRELNPYLYFSTCPLQFDPSRRCGCSVAVAGWCPTPLAPLLGFCLYFFFFLIPLAQVIVPSVFRFPQCTVRRS